jgi:hypothetical protein
VHAECKSVLDHLMVYRQERKIRDKLIRLHFGVSDTGRWRCQGNSRQVPESRNAKHQNPKSRRQFWILGVGDVKKSYYRSLGIVKCEMPKSRNRHTNKECRKPGNNSISGSRILGVEVSKHFITGVLKCQIAEMRNVEIPK